MNKKGFTLFEMLLIVVILIVIFLLSIPIIKIVIDNSKLGAFENSVYNAIDSVDYYIANNEFVEIPKEGLEISRLDSTILKNNNFDEGLFVREDKRVRMIYIKQDNFCAKGTKTDLKSTSKGCGALDETEPQKANLFVKTSDEKSITIVGAGYDEDSKIIKYELSIDGKKYYTNSDKSYNVFKVELDDNLEHSFKVRVTNEAGLTKESDIKKFKITNNDFILEEANNLKYIQTKKSIRLEENVYEYSTDLLTWNKIVDELLLLQNEIIYIRKIQDNNINTLNISNIDTTINGAIPELDENMIPVRFDGTNFVIANKNQTYWDYDNKIWANAVLVRKNKDVNDDNSKPRDYYKSDDAIGEIINPNDILAYYVWIPRYKYKLWNVNGKNRNIEPVEIEFENKYLEKSTKTRNDSWYTHPVFSYKEEYNGFWVSKYEASVSTDVNCYLVPNAINCNNSGYDIYSLDDRNSFKFISVSNASIISSNLNKQFNIYGFSDSIKPHLLTNLEWGSITYLLNSKYGENNVTTIADMNETGEYVMGNYNKDAGLDSNNNSGFAPDGKNPWPEQFIDIYKSLSLNGRILGDATMEVNEWYNNQNTFVNGENPFMIRGTNNIYSFINSTGSPNELVTFRPSFILSSNES